ncbi:hypothetical protein HAX54_014568 [Datura stramonium]|uniref:Uncharacterized protein n=1 Tax=Datura stramonium TaxID=4076 RepID=A0ABS8TQD1_DATST|nr:hypothetical protein [Datura stramonium]
MQARLCHGLRNAQVGQRNQRRDVTRKWHREGSGAPRMSGRPEFAIPIRLGTKAAKPNSNLRRNNEGFIYYYKYPLFIVLAELLLEIHQVLVEPFRPEILLNNHRFSWSLRAQLNLPLEEELNEPQRAKVARRAEEARLADIARRVDVAQLAAALVDRNCQNPPSSSRMKRHKECPLIGTV